MSKHMIRHDPQRCISCRACEVHCQVKNRTAAGVRPGVLITAGPDRLLDKVQVLSAFRPCFHCEKPWCVAVCPTGAMVKRPEDGFVHIVRDRCVGCRACVGACPWKVPQWDESSGRVVKCDGCYERVMQGEEPACVAGCTTHALSFSRPNENVRKARWHYVKSLLVAGSRRLKSSCPAVGKGLLFLAATAARDRESVNRDVKRNRIGSGSDQLTSGSNCRPPKGEKRPMPTAAFFRRCLSALSEIHASFDLEATQNAVVRNAVSLFDARGANLMLFNPSEENLLISASFGLSETYRTKGTISPRKSLGETIDRVPVIVRDIATDPRIQYPEATMKEGIRCVVGLPLTATSALVGALRLYFTQVREFTAEEMEFLQALALQAGHALKKAFYFASMKAAVSDIQRMPSTDIKEAMQSLLATVAKYGLARGSGLLMRDPKTNTLTTMVRYGLSQDYISKGPILAGFSLGEVTTGKPVVVSKVATDPRIQYKEAAAAEHILAILGLPIRIGSEIAGALRLYYPFEFDPGPDYIMWMEHLAHQVGIALEKTQLIIKLKERANWYEEVLRDLER